MEQMRISNGNAVLLNKTQDLKKRFRNFKGAPSRNTHEAIAPAIAHARIMMPNKSRKGRRYILKRVVQDPHEEKDDGDVHHKLQSGITHNIAGLQTQDSQQR